MAVAGGNYRPRDWTPIAGSDPVPGDPGAIRDEVTHMIRLAHMLRDQAGELRTIGEGEGLKGKYANALRDKSKELEVHLRQTAERYEHVHGHLSSWATELEDFQSQSVTILRQAQATEDDHKAKTQHGQHAPASAGDSSDPMQPHRQALERLTAHRDERASYYVSKIEGACHDVIKDSWWKHLADEIETNKLVQAFFTIASWVTTIVAIIALVITPAGLIMWIVLGLALLIAAKDILEAAAGDGSWFDVGLDIIGLLGAFGAVRALKALKGIQSATKVVAEGAAEERATADALEEVRPALKRTYRITNKRTASKAEKAAAYQFRGQLKAAAKRAGQAARDAEHARPMVEASKAQALLYGGDTEATSLVHDVGRLSTDYADSPAVLQASKHVGAWAGVAKGSFLVSATTDGVDKGLGLVGIQGYENLKDKYKLEVGSPW